MWPGKVEFVDIAEVAEIVENAEVVDRGFQYSDEIADRHCRDWRDCWDCQESTYCQDCRDCRECRKRLPGLTNLPRLPAQNGKLNAEIEKNDGTAQIADIGRIVDLGKGTEIA